MGTRSLSQIPPNCSLSFHCRGISLHLWRGIPRKGIPSILTGILLAAASRQGLLQRDHASHKEITDPGGLWSTESRPPFLAPLFPHRDLSSCKRSFACMHQREPSCSPSQDFFPGFPLQRTSLVLHLLVGVGCGPPSVSPFQAHTGEGSCGIFLPPALHRLQSRAALRWEGGAPPHKPCPTLPPASHPYP